MFREPLLKSGVSPGDLKRCHYQGQGEQRSAGSIREVMTMLASRLKAFLSLLLPMFVSMSSGAAMINGEELIDPTAPLFLTEPAGDVQDVSELFSGFASFRVNSILIRPNLRMAVVNSQQVEVGDRVGNAEVTDIQSGSVTLNIDGEERVIALYEKSIKTISEGER